MYVVDGYNLLHALKAIPGVLPADFGASRARLIELVGHLAGRESRRARIFFDGRPSELGQGDLAQPNVRVSFCGDGPESADRAIGEFVSNASQPRKLVVVSSDREVVGVCRGAGARIMSSQEMAGKLASMVEKGEGAPESGREKPVRGMVGELEQEMIDEIGDLADFERRVIEGENGSSA